jgi:uncharacterized protein (TIGR04255 family)
MPDDFYFPENIPLSNPPLIEAWLEVRWNLEDDNDSQFPFALGVFKESIEEHFGNVIRLEQAKFPIDFLPHIVRYRFNGGEQEYPMFQLGPGVASANFSTQYTWEEFKNEAKYLREKLNNAYNDNLSVERLALRYRNIIEIDPIEDNLLEFLQTKLNLSIVPPEHIPGYVADVNSPREINNSYSYDLTKPFGKGVIRLATAKNRSDDAQAILLELQLLSPGNENWSLDEAFEQWLEEAHSVLHEWFFAFINGSLLENYQ